MIDVPALAHQHAALLKVQHHRLVSGHARFLSAGLQCSKNVSSLEQQQQKQRQHERQPCPHLDVLCTAWLILEAACHMHSRGITTQTLLRKMK